MQIKFKELTLENFKNHQQLKVDFGENTSITGDNGKGKSSIGEAVSFTLYGTDLTGSTKFDPTPTNYETDSTVVTLLLDVDGKEFTLGREVAKGRKKYYINEVPSKATEFNQTVEQLFDKELFMSLFNPNYFFTLHKENGQRPLLLRYVTAPANKEVFKELPKPQADKLAELVKKRSLEDLYEMHRDNKNKQDKAYIAAQSRTKTLKGQLDQFGSLVPMSSLNTEKAQIENELKEKEEITMQARSANNEKDAIYNKLENLTMQINQGKDDHQLLKAKEIKADCYACGQDLGDDAKKVAEQTKEKELDKVAERVNPLIIKRKELREDYSNIKKIDVPEDLTQAVKHMNDKLFEIQHEMNKHKQVERLENDVKEAEESEVKTKESLNGSIFIIDAIKAFNAKEAELQAEKVQGLFDNLSIRLFDEVKSTGELKPTFVVQMDDKDYIKLSTAEKIKAGLELRDVLSDQSDLITPCFVDNAESITKFKEPNGQLIMARVEAGKELEVVAK